MAQSSQTPLFELDPNNPNDRENMSAQAYVLWTEYGDAKDVATAMHQDAHTGASVDIDERYVALLTTLSKLAHVSKMNGLQNSIHTPNRDELARRYGKKLPDLVSSAEIAGRQSGQDARSEFRAAFGYSQLVEVIGDLATAEMFGDTYDNFQDRYFGPKGNKAREKLRRKIHKNQKSRVDNQFAKRSVQKFMRQQSA